MKKILLIMAYIMPLLMLIGCSNDKDDKIPEYIPSDKPKEDHILKFETNHLTFTPQKQSENIKINTNIKYLIKIDGKNTDWINYNTNSNEYISFEVKPNNLENERSVKCVIYNTELNISDTLYIDQSINRERLALISIYKALNGDKWLNKRNWCTDRPLNEWEGIMANGDSEVFRLWISRDAYVNGEIPECIGDLIYLEDISFEYSNIRGELPKSIGNLIKLKRITISNCHFEGQIPEQVRNCTQLEYIDLSSNKFTGEIPNSFFLCKNLFHLDLSNNKFTEFYIEKEPMCNNLEYLAMNDNDIYTPMPYNLFNIKGLFALYAQNNKISGKIPVSVNNALNLNYLDLRNNKLIGNLPDLSNKSQLKSFDISNNDITGNIPNSYADIPNLKLYIHMNKMSGIIFDKVKQHDNFLIWSINPQQEGYELIY